MIRRALPTDIFRLMEMGQAFFKEAGWDQVAEFDPESFAYSSGQFMDHGEYFVAEHEGRVVGMVAAGYAVAGWNRKVLLGQEVWWYVEPAYRKGLGKQLLEALEDAFKQKGVFLVGLSAEEGLRSEALGRLFRQRGYLPRERLFWKVLAA